MSEQFKHLIEIGDVVTVISMGHQYRRYFEMAEKLGIDNWEYDRNLEPSDTFVVRGCYAHLTSTHKTIVWIEEVYGDYSYLIGIEGIQKIGRKVDIGFLEKDLFYV